MSGGRFRGGASPGSSRRPLQLRGEIPGGRELPRRFRELLVNLKRPPVVFDQTVSRNTLTPCDLLLHPRNEPFGFLSARPERFAGNLKIPRRRMREAEAVARPFFKATPSQPRRFLGTEPGRNLSLECAQAGLFV